MPTGSAAAVIKVPLWHTLGEAIRQVLGDLKAVGRSGWLPFLVLTLLGVATQLFYANGLGPPVPAGANGIAVLRAVLPIMLLGLIALVVQTLCYNAFMVSWYRLVLRPVDHTGLGSGYWPGFWRSLGYYALMVVGFIVFMVLVSVIVGVVVTIFAIATHASGNLAQRTGVASLVGAVVSGVLFFICFTRVTLVFPAAACGSSLGFRMGWRRMRGNTWRLIAAFFLVTIVYLGIELVFALTMSGTTILSVLSGTPPQITPAPAMLVFTVQLVSRFVLFLFLALTSSIAAIFYRELVLRPADVAEVFA